MPRPHAVLLHPDLRFSSGTERLFATARALSEQGVRVTLVSQPGSRRVAAKHAGVSLRLLELPPDPLAAPFAALRTRAALKAMKADILHFTDETLAALAARVAPAVGAPYLLELHGPIDGRVPIHARWFAGAIVPSGAQREAAVNHGRIPRARVRVLTHSPEPVPAEGPGPFEAEGPPWVGCSGLLDGSHDTEWFLDAARLVVMQGLKCQFAVLGEGPHETRLRRRIRKAVSYTHLTLPTIYSV